MTVLRENKDSLMAVLEAFVYNPLINWHLLPQTPCTNHRLERVLRERERERKERQRQSIDLNTTPKMVLLHQDKRLARRQQRGNGTTGVSRSQRRTRTATISHRNKLAEQ